MSDKLLFIMYMLSLVAFYRISKGLFRHSYSNVAYIVQKRTLQMEFQPPFVKSKSLRTPEHR